MKIAALRIVWSRQYRRTRRHAPAIVYAAERLAWAKRLRSFLPGIGRPAAHTLLSERVEGSRAVLLDISSDLSR